jgi:AraC family transcriptional regulator of adaptative response / DNA-3-methyladenine glycosylase II
VTPQEAERLSQPWRPWRSYAVMHLWRMGNRELSASQ